MAPQRCHWLEGVTFSIFLIVYEVVDVVLKQLDIVQDTFGVKDKTQLLGLRKLVKEREYH